MATLAPLGQITEVEVKEEMARMKAAWATIGKAMDWRRTILKKFQTEDQKLCIDPFDLV
jgi:sigma54-dependent transcription regulator